MGGNGNEFRLFFIQSLQFFVRNLKPFGKDLEFFSLLDFFENASNKKDSANQETKKDARTEDKVTRALICPNPKKRDEGYNEN